MDKGYAIVTGGSRGIGAALCVQLAKEGFNVLVNYCGSRDRAQGVVDSITQEYGVKAAICRAAVENFDDVVEMREFAEKTFGRKLSVLVNNAGLTNMTPFLDTKPEDWARVIGVDLFGTLNCCKVFVPLMVEHKFGRVVTISSTAGLAAAPGMADYCAAKGGQIAFTRTAAVEWGPFNITANVIAPGFVATDGTAAFGKELEDRIRAYSPIGQIGHVEDMQAALSYLINSPITTGQTLSPNCGTQMF